MVVIYIDFLSTSTWQRENCKTTAKKDEDKEDLTNLDFSNQAFTKLP